MSQNVSTAVMQRRVEAHDSLDDFPTPPWATRALCRWLQGYPMEQTWLRTCREPAANRGYMVKPLREFFRVVEASDVHDYDAGFAQRDFLFPEPLVPVDWTITNPPFRLAEQFIQRALETSTRGVAVIVRSAFLEGVGRHGRLFSMTPPTHVLQFAERVPMVKGRFDPGASTATAYVWLVWLKGDRQRGTQLHWLRPCRKDLEREDDQYIFGEPVAAIMEG